MRRKIKKKKTYFFIGFSPVKTSFGISNLSSCDPVQAPDLLIEKHYPSYYLNTASLPIELDFLLCYMCCTEFVVIYQTANDIEVLYFDFGLWPGRNHRPS